MVSLSDAQAAGGQLAQAPTFAFASYLGRAQVAAPQLLHPPYTSRKDTLRAIDEGTLYKPCWWRLRWFVTEA
jgi:hypothetical protein